MQECCNWCMTWVRPPTGNDWPKPVGRRSDPNTWARAALDQLHDGGGTALLAWLKSQQTGRRSKPQSTLEALINSIAAKVDLMNYPDDRNRGGQIGTGLQESTCKQLVGLRLKGPGMHGTDHGTLAITALRAIALNGHWHSFWKSTARSI
jgi:hypothetical protein